MNCRKVNHLLSAYMDGELPGVEYRQIHEHLTQCAECTQEYRTLLQTKRLLAAMRLQESRTELPVLILQHVESERLQTRSLGALNALRRLPQQLTRQLRAEISLSSRGMAIGASVAIAVIMATAYAVEDTDPTHAKGTIQWSANLPDTMPGLIATKSTLSPNSPLSFSAPTHWPEPESPKVELSPVTYSSNSSLSFNNIAVSR